MRIYCDGVFDLFHAGHLRHLETLASIDTNVELIVGIVSDSDSRGYKRRPVWTLEQRTHVIESLNCVSSVVSPCPLILDEEFIAFNKIDAVYHAFASKDDSEAQSKMFALCKCQ